MITDGAEAPSQRQTASVAPGLFDRRAPRGLDTGALRRVRKHRRDGASRSETFCRTGVDALQAFAKNGSTHDTT